MNKHKELIKNGFFSIEAGSWFTSEHFANIVDEIDDSKHTSQKCTKCTEFKIPRGKHEIRTLSIPNPYSYYLLTKQIAESWDELKNHYSDSEISITTPRYDKENEVFYFPKYNTSDMISIFFTKSLGATYLLKTDIKEYYSSIYSHSIPWALHGKEYSKNNRKDNNLGNKLDLLIRNLRDGQTNGIPIGPSASVIISEIIGTSIDKELQDMTQDIEIIDKFRYIDDYYFFFKTRSDAEVALSKFEKICRNYELEINAKKTKIDILPIPLEAKWISEINNLNLNSNFVLSFINNVLKIQSEHPEENVLVYGLYKLYYTDFDIINNIDENQWRTLKSFLLNCFIYDSQCAMLSCEVLIKFNQQNNKFKILESEVFKIINVLLDNINSRSFDYSMLWILQLCKILDLRLTNELLDKCKNVENPLIITIILSEYHDDSRLEKRQWEKYMIEDNLYNKYWILAYEGLAQGWIKSYNNIDYISKNSFFKFLRDKNVSFVNSYEIDDFFDERNDDNFYIPNPVPSIHS